MSEFVVYVIRCQVNGKVYVGKTGRPKHRWYMHRCLGRTSGDSALYRAMRKYGVDAFTFEILERCLGEAHSFERESAWISKLRSFGPGGYNMSAGGEGQSGYRHREADKPKMGRAGSANPNYGRPWTEEEKLAQAERSRLQFAEKGHPWLGRQHTPEARAKMANAAKGNKRCVGRVASEETRLKMSESHAGHDAWNKGRKTGPRTMLSRERQAESMRRYWARKKLST